MIKPAIKKAIAKSADNGASGLQSFLLNADEILCAGDYLIVEDSQLKRNDIDKFLKKDQNKHLELAAEDLRMATRHLGSIVGKVDVEEILGSIFKDFCIGK